MPKHRGLIGHTRGDQAAGWIIEEVSEVSESSEGKIAESIGGRGNRDYGRKSHLMKLKALVGPILLGLSGVAFAPLRLWSAQPEAIPSPLRLLQLVAVMAAVVIAVVLLLARIGRPVWPAAATIMLSGLWFGVSASVVPASLALLVPLVIWMLITGALGLLLYRLDNYAVRALMAALATFVISQPILGYVLSNPLAIPSDPGPPSIAVGDNARSTDLAVVVFDAYNSFTTMERDLPTKSLEVRDTLIESGFQVSELAWSPSTRTLISLSALFDGRLPEQGSDSIEVFVKRMTRSVGGSNRTFSAFQDAGYVIRYVESGWSTTVCGPEVDVCARRPFVDDSIQAVIDMSLVGPHLAGGGGHGFGKNALHSLGEVDRALKDMSGNSESELLFAHVVMPHGPYVVDDQCGSTGQQIPEGGGSVTADNHTASEIGYVQQSNCVDLWISRYIESSDPEMSILFLADHGSALRLQTTRDPWQWTPDEIRERASVLLAARTPSECGSLPTLSTLAAFAWVVGCHLDADPVVSDNQVVRLYGSDYEPRCVVPLGPDSFKDVTC